MLTVSSRKFANMQAVFTEILEILRLRLARRRGGTAFRSLSAPAN